MIEKISTLICVHSNSREYDMLLARAIASLAEQTEQPDEIVIVFDECWEETEGVVNNLINNPHWFSKVVEIKLVTRDKKEGLAFAKNEGLKHCTGDWITFLDADDQWMPCKLEVQKNYLKNSSVELCFTEAWDNYNGVLKPNCFRVGQYETHDQIISRLPHENVLCHGSAMIRKSVLDNLGGYRHYKGREDYDLWLRAATAGYRFAKVPERLYIYSMGTGIER